MKNLTLVCEAAIRLNESAADQGKPKGMIEACVTTWGAREGEDGRKFNYQPEGFADWATNFAEGDKPLPMFLNHNDNGLPSGEWTEFNFTKEGMTAKGRLFLETMGGSDLYKILTESPNMFGGVSVGAYAEEARFVDEQGNPCTMGPDGAPLSNPEFDAENAYFQITKGGLREVSIVMYPNNPEAGICKLEAFDDQGQINPRALERILRDAGLHKKDATTASSIVKKMLAERDAPIIKDEAPIRSESDAVENSELLEALEMRELAEALSKRI